MAWDPTDSEAWQRTFERSTSTSPLPSSRPSTELRIGDSNETHKHSDAPGDYDDYIDPALKAASLNQALQSTSLPSRPNHGSFSSQADTIPALSTPDAKALQDYVNGKDSPAPRLRLQKNGKRRTGGEHSSRKRRANDAFNEHAISNHNAPASSKPKRPRPSPCPAPRSTTRASKSPSAPSFSPITTTQQPILVGDVMISSSAAGARTWVSSPAPPRRSSSIFGSDQPGLVHDINDEDSPYAQVIKSSPYTGGLLPKIPVDNAPQSATEAGDQLKQAFLYHRARSRSTPRHARTGLQKILANLKKRHEVQVKLCEASGLTVDSDTWAKLSDITENRHPNASILSDDLNGLIQDRFAKYEADVARWDKAVGQSAIVRKCMYFEEQISVLEEMIESVSESKAVDAAASGSVALRMTKAAEKQLELRRRVQEMKSGRRFSGLIEKD